VPLIEAIQQLRATGWKGLPEITVGPQGEWSPAQAGALAKAGKWPERRQFAMGSFELAEFFGELAQEVVSSLAGPGRAEGVPRKELPGLEIAGVSSLAPQPPVAGEQGPFWFNVNAELVIYGATEPDARLAVGGREIRLRPDGTFSCRFSLPDGKYSLRIRAVSADGAHSRSAELEFRRGTQFDGSVGQHPQDPNLKPPTEANFG
jgi:hypothetical protein